MTWSLLVLLGLIGAVVFCLGLITGRWSVLREQVREERGVVDPKWYE